MTMYLWDLAQVQAVGDAIRAKTGKSATMTMAEMPAEIASISGERTYKEVWLHGCQQRNGQLMIDTHVQADMNHTLEVVGYGNLYSSSTLFGSVMSTGSRQVIDLLTSTMKVRVAWANSGLKTYTFDVSVLSPWHPATFRFNKNGLTINGFTSSYNPSGAIQEDYSASVTGNASNASYKIFPNVSSTSGGAPGVFRSAKIFDASDNLIHHFVPIMYNDWTLGLLDKVTNTVQMLPAGETGFEAYYAPYTDALVNLAD